MTFPRNSLILITILTIVIGCSQKPLNKETLNEPLNAVAETSLQDSLAFELCKIYGFDQGIRDSKLTFNKKELMPKIDSLNFDKLMNIIITYGYPTDRLLGKRNMSQECVESAATAILLHNPHRIVKDRKNFDLLLDEVKKGDIDPHFFASVLDKYYWVNSTNKKQRRVFYGSQFGKPCIQTKEATNRARIEIGLEPLNDDGFTDCGKEHLNIPVK